LAAGGKWRSLWSVFASLAAWIVYVTGLASPLTPSEGMPSVWDVAVFCGAPAIVLVGCACMVRTRLATAFVAAEAVAIVFLSAWLLARLHA
jgi:hypothetical protein